MQQLQERKLKMAGAATSASTTGETSKIKSERQ